MRNTNKTPAPPIAPSWKGPETDKQKFGKRMAQLRNDRGMTQLQLAIMADRDRSFISDLENGKKEPALGTLRLLADSFDMSIEELLHGF